MQRLAAGREEFAPEDLKPCGRDRPSPASWSDWSFEAGVRSTRPGNRPWMSLRDTARRHKWLLRVLLFPWLIWVGRVYLVSSPGLS